MRRLALTAAAVLAIAAAGSVSANDKVVLCHAAGLDGTTQYVTLEVGYPAAYGPAGHFYENGTPQAGHEEDYLGPCEVPATPTPPPTASPTPAPTPTASPSPEPSASPTAGPSDEPSPAPSVTPEPALPETDTEEPTQANPLQLLLLGGLFTAFAVLGFALGFPRR